MSIDWLTVAAQLVNFLVLVWLLKRFLYRPILDGIDAREQEIAERMSEASRIKEDAKSTVADYHQQLQSLQQDRTTTLEQARQEAREDRDALLNETRERIRQEQAAAKHQQRRQAEEYINHLHQMSAQAILQVVNKALADLSDETLEERLVLHALSSLHQQLPQATGDMATPDTVNQTVELTLTTRNPMDEAARDRIRTSATTLWPDCSIHFREDEQQAAGALVQFGSSQVEWTVDAYVNELEVQLQKQLEAEADSAPRNTDPQSTQKTQEPGQASEDRQS